jgi:hypothetical protein
MSAPLTNELSSDAKKRATAAISSGSPSHALNVAHPAVEAVLTIALRQAASVDHAALQSVKTMLSSSLMVLCLCSWARSAIHPNWAPGSVVQQYV